MDRADVSTLCVARECVREIYLKHETRNVRMRFLLFDLLGMDKLGHGRIVSEIIIRSFIKCGFE